MSECCGCGEDGATDRVFCCGPRRHAVCRACFPNYLSARGLGPFPELTVAESTMLRCPMDRTDDCRLDPPCKDPWMRSFFTLDDVLQKGFMTPSQLEKLREASRRAQLLMQDDGLKLETMERLVPIVREYRTLCLRLQELWREEDEAMLSAERLALSGDEVRGGSAPFNPRACGELCELMTCVANDLTGGVGGGTPQGIAAEQAARGMRDLAAQTEKAVRRLHSTLTRTPMNALSEEPAAAVPAGPPPRLVRCLACPSGLYYVPGGRCLVCEREHCCDCGEVLHPHESCKESDVLSFAEVVRTTQTCPSCRSMVHRTGGCDQMFCTQCNTPFSYRTGERVQDQIIHNPHFLELPDDQRMRIQKLRTESGCREGDIETALMLKQAPQPVMRAWWFLGHVRDTLPDDRNSVEHYDFELANRLQRIGAITGERIAPPPSRGKPAACSKAYTDAERITHLLLTHTKHRKRSELLWIHTEFEEIASDLFAQLSLSADPEEDANVMQMIETVWNTLVEKSAPYGDFKNSVGRWLSAEGKRSTPAAPQLY